MALACARLTHHVWVPVTGSEVTMDPPAPRAIASLEEVESATKWLRKLEYPAEIRRMPLCPKTDVPATASTVMLTVIGSLKLVEKVLAAAIQAARAAGAFAPKFASKLVVKV